MCDTSGPNTGSILSLNAIGKQDTYLLEDDPIHSLFKYEPKRHANFTKFHKNLNVNKPSNASATWPFGKTIKVTYNPKNMGDLLANMYVTFEMPRLTGSDSYYADQIGRHIFKSVTMRVDETVVEKYHGDWGIIYDELYLDESEKRTKRYTLNRNNAEDTSLLSGNQFLAQETSRVYIPIPLLFSRKYESDEYETNKPNRPYFPTCAIHKQKLQFEFEFHKQSFFTNETDELTISEFDIVTEEITLEPSERAYIANKRHVLVTDIVKKHPTLDIPVDVKNAKIELIPNTPVKTINWFFRQKAFENEDVFTGGTTLLANVFANRYNFSSNVEYSVNNEFYNPPMSSAKIFVNGEDIPNIQDSDHKYFKYVVPFSSRLSRPLRNIYTYAFSMNPINVEPSGMLDFSQLQSNRTILDVNMKTGLTSDYTLHLYYVGYQTFIFENGVMTLV
mgnify:FL=1|tara:strand:- start:3460 stop:4800 length:1341 start_codon:yes stop_codon:yes gene_type:complete